MGGTAFESAPDRPVVLSLVESLSDIGFSLGFSTAARSSTTRASVA
jgi:hypothetical protein